MLVPIGLYVCFLCALLTTLVGIIQILDNLSRWCDSTTQTCIGPGLVWSNGDFIEDVNSQWRTVFTFRPDPFADQWTALVLGLMSLFVHISPSVRWNAICSSWYRVFWWQLFVALWGNFGYAGNFGILVGFVTSLAALLALMVALTYTGAPTVLEVRLNGTLGRCVCENSDGSNCVASFAYVSMIVAALGTLATGIANVVTRFPDPCNPETNSCVGPGLFWNPSSEKFITDVNGPFGGRWRTLFTLQPSILLDIWTPVIFGVVAFMTQLTSFRWSSVSSSWTRVLLFHLVMAFFANFGYVGNLGVIVGFISSFVAFLALILMFFSALPQRTHADVDIFAHVRLGATFAPRQYSA